MVGKDQKRKSRRERRRRSWERLLAECNVEYHAPGTFDPLALGWELIAPGIRVSPDGGKWAVADWVLPDEADAALARWAALPSQDGKRAK